ncbi:MAG: hypothetical protein QG638_601 [Pseudomonadota bacterium]|nr:hypothetical protein [Pseudomonadota bacterium]
MPYLHRLMIGILSVAALSSIQTALAGDNVSDKAEQRRQGQIKEEERQQKLRQLYDRMAREGISRDAVEALGTLGSRTYLDLGPIRVPPYAMYNMILAGKVLKPSDHYRFELDEHILTMVVPDAIVSSSWIVPYADSRTEPERDAALKRSKGGLQVANLAWHYGTGIWPLFIGWKGRMNMSITYTDVRIVKNAEDISTPEKLRQRASTLQKGRIPSQEQINYSESTKYLAHTRIYLGAETIVINGRAWIREAMNEHYSRSYIYRTALLPDRMLSILIDMPQFDYNGNPDATSYPDPLKQAIAQMEAMMASLRVAKRSDDGKADPFVIERVEPGPLPVREKRPAAD